jgi:hypothetical protein
MRDTLHKIEEMLQAISQLQEDEVEFFSSYLQHASHELRHFQYGHIQERLKLGELWDQFRSTSYPEFVQDLLSWCYLNDDYNSVSHVCGLLYGPLPETEEIEQILLKGIWDRQKSNRLRERFFWCFNYHFKDTAVQFFVADLSRYLQENADNEELTADIINFMHWHMQEHPDVHRVKDIALRYINEHPEVKVHILSSTKEILGIS